MPSLLVLGAGWVGAALVARHPGAAFTHRTPRPGALELDLARPQTWAGLPRADRVVWTFPAAPAEDALKLYLENFSGARTVVLGSTSAYLAAAPDARITEESALDLSQPRVRGEEALRARGAIVLALAGLHGPGRDPVRWLLSGRIDNGAKRVNLAHLDDVLAAVEAALERGRPGERLNVCDGEARPWRDHVRRLQAAGRLPAGFSLPERAPDASSRRVSNERLAALLGPAHRFRTEAGEP